MQFLILVIILSAALLFWQGSDPPQSTPEPPAPEPQLVEPLESTAAVAQQAPAPTPVYAENIPTATTKTKAAPQSSQHTQKTGSVAVAAPAAATVINAPLAHTETGSSLAVPSRAPAPRDIPPGFESLFEEQQSFIDVYFAGRFIGSYMASFTPDTIRFDQPSAIVQKIPSALEPQQVIEALTDELPTHQELRCYYRGQSNCGVLNPAIAGVIFNADNFRADVFINSSLLAVSQSGGKYLPPSSADLSFLQTVNYAFTGTDDDVNEEDNLFLLSLLSYKENALRMVANYSDDVEGEASEFEISTLVAQRDWQGVRYLGGYFQTINEDLRFTAETEMVGLRVGTSLDTREDERQLSGRSIQVFLQSRGEVSIFKDDRLISTRIYDAGNQILDTSALPGGSYDIDIRIRDAGGERIETQFYVKNANLPPEGEPLYFVEMGRISESVDSQSLPDPVDEYLLRGSINTRLNFNNALISGLSTTEDDSVFEAGWFGVGNYYDVLVNTAIARHDRYGFNTEARFNYQNAWLTSTYRRIWDDNTDPDLLEQDYGYLNLLGEEQEQLTADLSFPVKQANVSFGSRYIDRPASDSVTDYSASVDFEIFRTMDSNTRFRLEYNHSDDDDFVIASFTWRMSQDHFTYNVRPDYEWSDVDGESNADPRLNASADWDSRDLWSSDLRAGVSATSQSDFNSYGANADWAGRHGRVRGQAEYVDRDGDENTTRVNGNAATSFVVNDQSAALGGKEQNQAAVIIDLKGSAEDVFFDVLVNGGRHATARPGKKTLLSLRPFETYRISLRARGQQFVYFDDREYDVTLYPGNVVKLGWEADVVNIVFGRIKDQHGQPIANALLKGVSGVATTDSYGLFQAEVKQSLKTIAIETITQQCQLELPEYQVRRGIATLGTLQCELRDK